VIPLPVSTGALVRIASLVATDTFGVRTAIVPANTALPSNAFHLYRVASAGGAGLEDMLFVPPVLPAAVESAPVEEVAIVRDEGANIGWGIERIVPDASGRALRVRRQGAEPRMAVPATRGERLTYVPGTAVEPGWFPLAVRRDASGARILERARIVIGDDTDRIPGGAVLAGTFSVFDDEVPREGIVVRRRWQLARALDGTLCLWITRTREPAAGEVATGFVFDGIV